MHWHVRTLLVELSVTMSAGRFTSYKAEEFKPGAHPEVISAQTSVIVARINEALRTTERQQRSKRAWNRVKLAIRSDHAFFKDLDLDAIETNL